MTAENPVPCATGRPELLADKFYYLTPSREVFGPFDSHRAAWLSRAAWAYDCQDSPDRAELLSGTELASDYSGLYGSVRA